MKRKPNAISAMMTAIASMTVRRNDTAINLLFTIDRKADAGAIGPWPERSRGHIRLRAARFVGHTRRACVEDLAHTGIAAGPLVAAQHAQFALVHDRAVGQQHPERIGTLRPDRG